MVPCIVIKQLKNGHNCYTADKDTDQYDTYGDQMLRTTIHWRTLFKCLNFTEYSPPHTLVDETGLDPNTIVKLDMSVDFDNLEKIRKSVAPYGLTIVEEDRLLDCIIINDPAQ